MVVGGALVVLLVDHSTEFALLLIVGVQHHDHAPGRRARIHAPHIFRHTDRTGHMAVKGRALAVVNPCSDADLWSRRCVYFSEECG